jgi:hypothetical protein
MFLNLFLITPLLMLILLNFLFLHCATCIYDYIYDCIVIIFNILDEMTSSQCVFVVLTYITFKVLVGKDIYECAFMTTIIIDPLHIHG